MSESIDSVTVVVDLDDLVEDAKQKASMELKTLEVNKLVSIWHNQLEHTVHVTFSLAKEEDT
jgi:hypothetical protein